MYCGFMLAEDGGTERQERVGIAPLYHPHRPSPYCCDYITRKRRLDLLFDDRQMTFFSHRLIVGTSDIM